MSIIIESKIPEVLKAFENKILTDWIKAQLEVKGGNKDTIIEADLMQQSKQFLNLFQEATQSNNLSNVSAHEWKEVRDYLDEVSQFRTEKGQTTEQIATFIFSLKQPITVFLQKAYADDPERALEEIWTLNSLLDKLGLFTMQLYQIKRETVIRRQQEELLELSTPVLKLWDGILALPMIGTLDSNRTQIIMENLLQKILEYNCEIAIIDITGVPSVDTLVAQHLLKAVTAARLMGTECIISGIRPQIAQTIVHLGVELGDVITKATLIDAFRYSLTMLGKTLSITPSKVNN